MSKIITQKAEENKQISERIKSFMKRFDISSALKSSNAVKIKGFAVIEIFEYLFMLVFSHRSMYMDMKKDNTLFSKDTVCRFLNSARINWLKFTTRLSSKIIEDTIEFSRCTVNFDVRSLSNIYINIENVVLLYKTPDAVHAEGAA